jgi:cystathionine beta-lyase/cystathionine gamma-synthase
VLRRINLWLSRIKLNWTRKKIWPAEINHPYVNAFRRGNEQVTKSYSRWRNSLGSVESLAGHPLTMSHESLPAARREELGIGRGLVRLSIEIEVPADLIEDLDQTLERV